MTTSIVVANRWRSVKWYGGKDDVAERLALGVECLRKNGFVAKCEKQVEVKAPGQKYQWESVLYRVQIYGGLEDQRRARNVLRGFWAALQSNGLSADYRDGFVSGADLLSNLGRARPGKLPKPIANPRRLKA